MKKLLTMLLCLMLGMMLAVLPAAAEQPAAEYPVDFSEEPYEVHIIMTVQTQVPTQEGSDRVVAELNKLTLRDLNMTVKLEIMDFSQYSQNVPLAMASREKIDLVALPFNYIISMGGAGYIYNLNPYLETYGKNIIGTPEAWSGYELDYTKAGDCVFTPDEFIAALNNFCQHPRPRHNTYSREVFVNQYSAARMVDKFRAVLKG